ncbi:SDR family oxidoreductase [Geminocystis sp. NIES-3709]|uniref:SDR family NAD(P)-dependent oxidoreductase n=1 Tax=Geminocystis sp. NIES-3709 TaxID=1617448 RepID=UPI0005FC567C|nr:SDR family oxidoreductase [Geminocystis sp. NIES-3709]BAQ66504.1 short-chain dehydrogenase/reductase SDR [Geminocystis sp. NIES-3709]
MKTALITGASSGIGKAFAQELAQRNYNLIMVARSKSLLLELQEKLQSEYSIKVKVICQDLSISHAGEAIFKEVKQDNIFVDLLINNAGFGDYGRFIDRDLQKQLNMIQVNISALVELTHLFLTEMKQEGKGEIINVSSIAGYQPLPYLSVYAATKAFVLSFSEALWAEYKSYGIKILALCPGPTESKFPEVAEFTNFPGMEGNQNGIAKAEDVVKNALSALEKSQANVVTGGIGNQIVVNLSRFFPRELIVKGIEKQFRQN